jgi:hypothetical protein
MESGEVLGGCFCGASRYRARARPSSQAICHCASCRRAAGAQAVAWVTFPAGSFTVDQGEPGRFRAPNGAVWAFCPHCGTTLTYQHDHRPGEVDVTTGSLDDPEAFPPTRDVNLDEKVSWVERLPPATHLQE